MSKRTLWVWIESVTVFHNGDVPGQHGGAEEEKRNAVIGTLVYPRSGAPTVTSGQQYSLVSNVAFHPDSSNFFASGLFKEDVQDETLLHIKITDTDPAGKATKIFLGILGPLLGAGMAEATAGLATFFGAVAGAGVGQITTGFSKLAQDQVYVIGETEILNIHVDDLPGKTDPRRMTLGLVVPENVVKPFQSLTGPDHAPVTEYFRLAKGSSNGVITLRMGAEPI